MSKQQGFPVRAQRSVFLVVQAISICACISACLATPADIPANARLRCQPETASADCPPGWICRALIGECRSPEGLDEVAPSLEAIELAPQLARLGTQIDLSFSASEALWTEPVVRLADTLLQGGTPWSSNTNADGGTAGGGVGGELPASRRYALTYVATGAEPENLPQAVEVELLDENGVAATVTAGTITFDFTTPTVTSAIVLEPADGWLALDEELTVSFSLSETLPEDLPPTVTLVAQASEDQANGEQLMLELESQNGASYTYTYLPNGDEPEGFYRLELSFTDAVGNAGSEQGPAIELDFTPPTVINSSVRYDPDANNPITGGNLIAGKSGTSITIRIDASERLDEVAGVSLGIYQLLNFVDDENFTLGARLPLETLDPPGVGGGPPLTTTVSATRVVAEGELKDRAPSGIFFLEVTWSDLAGNETTLFLDQETGTGFILLRNQRPRLNVLQEQITVVRAPWGTRSQELLGSDDLAIETDDDGNVISTQPRAVKAPAGPYFAILPGDPLAAEAGLAANTFTFTRDQNDPVARLIPDPVVQVIVYIDQDGPEISRIGRLLFDQSTANQDWRWFRTQLPNLPFNRLFVTGIDLAGNESQRVQLTRAQWVAHPGGATQEGIEAPAFAEQRAGSALLGATEERVAYLDAPDPTEAAVWGNDGVVEAHLGAGWRQISLATETPFPNFGADVAYDLTRDRVVLFGAEAVGSDDAQTWEWNGRAWKNVTPEGPSPSPRAFPTLAFDRARGRTVLFGGTVLGAFNPDDLWEWDGVAWTEVAPSTDEFFDVGADAGSGAAANQRPVGRFGHSMAYDPARERMLIYGGSTFDFQSDTQENLADLWAWDGTRWTELAMTGDLPGPRVIHGMALDEVADTLVLWRGTPDLEAPIFDSNDTWVLDLETLVWTAYDLPDVPTLPPADPPFSIPIAPLNPAFFHAGIGQIAAIETRADSRFHVVAWNGSDWDTVAVAPQPDAPELLRIFPVATYLAREDRIFFAGGVTATAAFPLTDSFITWELDANQGWQRFDPTPGAAYSPRSFASLTWDSVRKVAVLSGGGEVFPGAEFLLEGQSNDLFELNGSAWVDKGVSLGPRSYLAGALFLPGVGVESVVFFGGASRQDGALDAVDVDGQTHTWNGASSTSSVLDPSPTPRISHVMATHGSGDVLLFGGFDAATGLRNDLWRFDGAWSLVTVTGASPSPRMDAAMVFDPQNNVMVLHGGYVLDGEGGLEASGETWLFSGGSWTLVNGSGPGPRIYHTLTYDTVRERVVLFGGLSDQFNGDLWEWNGSTWMRAHEGGTPLFRFGHGTAYDPERGRLITAAGISDKFIYQSTTFERRSPLATDVPAVTFVAPSQSAPFRVEAVDEVVLRARCSGRYRSPGGQMAIGAELAVWDSKQLDAQVGGWRRTGLTTTTGPGESPGWMTLVETAAEAQKLLLRRDRKLALQCRPLGFSNGGFATVAASFMEVRVSYSLAVETNCLDDGFVDDDGDGYTNCADLDCRDACFESSCGDETDNDNDGLVDCADDDCDLSPLCFERVCFDNIDNDGDGLSDCADPDCNDQPVCNPGGD